MDDNIHWAEKLSDEGKEIERGLQIASGAALLALVALLSGVWTDFDTPPFNLRIVVIEALTYFGFAFILAVGATFTRVLAKLMLSLGEVTDLAFLRRPVKAPRWITRILFHRYGTAFEVIIWAGLLLGSFGMFVYSGQGFLRGLVAATSTEIDTAGRKISAVLNEQEEHIKRNEERIQRLEHDMGIPPVPHGSRAEP